MAWGARDVWRSGRPRTAGGRRLTVSRHVHLVVIGGVDPGGGAGVVRDFLTARAFGASVRLIVSALTEQSEHGVGAVEARDPATLQALVSDGLTVSVTPGGGDSEGRRRSPRVAVKIGMLPDGDSASAVERGLAEFRGPVVIDPVLAASSGGRLWKGDLARLLALASRATLLTPNAAEAAALTGLPVRTLSEAADAGQALRAAGVGAVLVKGGHLIDIDTDKDNDGFSTDVLVSGAGVRTFVGERRPGAAVRGTGCALATAIAVGLGAGLPIEEAIAAAKTWLGGAIGGAVDVGGERHLS